MDISELTEEQVQHVTPIEHRDTPFEELPDHTQRFIETAAQWVYGNNEEDA